MGPKLIHFFIATLLAFCLFSCNQSQDNTRSSDGESLVQKPDTVYINFDSLNQINNSLNAYLSKAQNKEIIDSLNSWTFVHDVDQYVDVDSLFGHYKSYGKFYKSNIPTAVYQRLFPNEEINQERTIIKKGSRLVEKNGIIYSYFGREIKEDRHYKSLYSIVEKENYIHLIFAKEGKYAPALDLLTFNKSDLKIVDQLELKDGIIDAGEINYWISQFKNDFKNIEKKIIKNPEYWGNADTTIQLFNIDDTGNIRLEKESYKKFIEQ